ncbi:alpha-L-rhamnosidase C-terminal domain-containing protein [Nonomuraea sp. NPDC048881]|uniref:alpha-L-rhamnosidase-related protein n=1 Tax=Nonomuraea sp. NPDC048881 TaxID=3155030 RepID=UPI0033D728CA
MLDGQGRACSVVVDDAVVMVARVVPGHHHRRQPLGEGVEPGRAHLRRDDDDRFHLAVPQRLHAGVPLTGLVVEGGDGHPVRAGVQLLVDAVEDVGEELATQQGDGHPDGAGGGAHGAGGFPGAVAELGLSEDARRYRDLAAQVRRAFAAAYVTERGLMVSDTPTAYAMALHWDLLPTPEQREAAGTRLADLVRANGFRVATGFVGTPLITDALTEAGYPHLAFRLLLERSCPSWLYPVTMGATTIWERWDSMLPDGSINPGQMTSFNHYALGAVADWLHRRVAGLAPAAPGYRRIEVRPLPGHGLTWAEADLETPYGDAGVAWRISDGTLILEARVPPGTEAIVHLPGREPFRTGPGHHQWKAEPPPPASPEVIADAVDDAWLWERLTQVMTAHGVIGDPAALAARGLRLPLSELASVVAPRAAPEQVGRLRSALEEQLRP